MNKFLLGEKLKKIQLNVSHIVLLLTLKTTFFFKHFTQLFKNNLITRHDIQYILIYYI